jgi:hypothetical protein
MRRYIIGFLVFFVLLAAYWAWPFASLERLATSLTAGDRAAMADEIDFNRLRSSLSSQIVAAYVRLIGAKPGLFSGPDLLGLALFNILTPENLTNLLEGQVVSTDIGPVSLDFGDLPTANFGSLWSGWLGTEYWMDYFSIGVPADRPSSDQYRVQMKLTQWRWKVVGLDLPEKVLLPIAQELAKKYP